MVCVTTPLELGPYVLSVGRLGEVTKEATEQYNRVKHAGFGYKQVESQKSCVCLKLCLACVNISIEFNSTNLQVTCDTWEQ